MPTFTVNTSRFEPYSTSRFVVYFDKSTTPVAGISKVTGLKRTADPVEYREGGNLVTLKGLGRVKYEPITLERGITHDAAFEDWANAAQVLDNQVPKRSLKDLRKTIHIVLQNEQGQAVHRYTVHRCWVAEYQAMPDLDAGQNAVAIEHIRLEHEGWERDESVTEPDQSKAG